MKIQKKQFYPYMKLLVIQPYLLFGLWVSTNVNLDMNQPKI